MGAVAGGKTGGTGFNEVQRFAANYLLFDAIALAGE
jgi:hypothetical protein